MLFPTLDESKRQKLRGIAAAYLLTQLKAKFIHSFAHPAE